VERREFCVNGCRLVTAIAASSFVEACAGGSGMSPDDVTTLTNSVIPRVTASVTNRTIALRLANVSSLAVVGGVALIATASVNVLVARRGDQEFAAVSAECTHEGCTIDRFSGQTYVCQCHGSEFTVAGAVTHGPASRALEVFPTELADGTLSITV
jgi:cytochrome b6-f complex iron-sulfur subunit